MIFILIRNQKNQQHKETESDLRAVDLCGDAEALIRGLVKIHTANRVPRRWSAEFERMASHPSLARRIQDIRRHTAEPTKEPDETSDGSVDPSGDGALDPDTPFWAEIFVSRNSDSELVVLGQDRVHWLNLPENSGNGFSPATPWNADRLQQLRSQTVSERAVAYSGLMELRLVMTGKAGTLRAVADTGSVVTFPLKDEDHAALQQNLDRVDGQLAPPKASFPNTRSSVRQACLLMVLCSLLSAMYGAVSVGVGFWVALAGGIALAVPHRTWVIAACSMALLAALPPLLSPELIGDAIEAWAAPMGIGIAGLWGLFRLFARKQDAPGPFALPEGNPTHAVLTFLLLGAPFLLCNLTALGGKDPLLALYTWGANAQGSFFPLLGVATALFQIRRRSARGFALLLGMLSLSHLFLGSTFFLTEVAKDPLAAEAPSLTLETAEYRIARETYIGRNQSMHRLSPQGSRFLTQQFVNYDYENYEDGDFEEENLSITYFVADFDEHVSEVTALALDFVGEDRLLALRKNEEGHRELQALSASDPEQILWRLTLPSLDNWAGAELTTDGDRWQIIANQQGNRTYRLAGYVGNGEIEHTVWAPPGWSNHLFGKGDFMFEVALEEPDTSPESSLWWTWLSDSFYPKLTVRLTDSAGSRNLATTMLQVDCQAPKPSRSDVLCLASSNKENWAWGANLETGAFEPLARLAPIESISSRVAYHAWDWDGRRLTLLQSEHLFLIDPREATGVRIPLPKKTDWGVSMTASEEAVALSWPAKNGMGYRVFLLDTPSSAKPAP